MRSRYWIGALLLVGPTLGVLWLLFAGDAGELGRPAASVAAPAVPEPSTLQRETQPAEVRQGPGRLAWASTPLPPIDTPFKSVLKELEQRANDGDPRAACRLVAEYGYCNALKFLPAENAKWLASQLMGLERLTEPEMHKSANELIQQQFEVRETRATSLADHCEGVALPSSSAIVQMWRRAANLGSDAAMRQYASGNAFRWSQIMDSLPELEWYRGEAEAMALTVARKGDLSMMLALAAGYSSNVGGSRSLLAQSLTPDQAMSLAIYEHVHRALANDTSAERQFFRADVEVALSEARRLASAEESGRASQLLVSEMDSWHLLQTQGVSGYLDTSGSQRDVSREACE